MPSFSLFQAAVKDIAVTLHCIFAPLYTSSRGSGGYFVAALPAILLSNAILQATGTHKGYRFAPEVDAEWFLWLGRETLHLTTAKKFTTPATSRETARIDLDYFYRFFDKAKIEAVWVRFSASVSSANVILSP
jgi:hypothetical protein